MYAIIDKNTRFIANKIEYHCFIKSFRFGELGWQTTTTKFKHEAKLYKTHTGAWNAARRMGCQFDVIEV